MLYINIGLQHISLGNSAVSQLFWWTCQPISLIISMSCYALYRHRITTYFPTKFCCKLTILVNLSTSFIIISRSCHTFYIHRFVAYSIGNYTISTCQWWTCQPPSLIISRSCHALYKHRITTYFLMNPVVSLYFTQSPL